MLLRLLDEQYLKTPFYGSRRMTAYLREQGYDVNRKRVIKLMRKLGLQTIYQKSVKEFLSVAIATGIGLFRGGNYESTCQTGY